MLPLLVDFPSFDHWDFAILMDLPEALPWINKWPGHCNFPWPTKVQEQEKIRGTKVKRKPLFSHSLLF